MGYIKGMGYGHFLLGVAVSFVRFYPGNGLFEATGVPGKGWAKFTGMCVYFSSPIVLQFKSCLAVYCLQGSFTDSKTSHLFFHFCSTFIWYFEISSKTLRHIILLVRLVIVSMEILEGHVCPLYLTSCDTLFLPLAMT